MNMEKMPRFPLTSCFFVLGHVGAVGAWRIHWPAAAPTFQRRVGAVGANLFTACHGVPALKMPRLVLPLMPHSRRGQGLKITVWITVFRDLWIT
jgi:hypothetical protein